MSLEQELTAWLGSLASVWDEHDTAAMAALWREDGDLINPFGRKASGRVQVEELLRDEHAGPMRLSSYRVVGIWARELRPGLAFLEWDGEITGMRAGDGEKLPPFKHHVSALIERRDDAWLLIAARPHTYQAPPR